MRASMELTKENLKNVKFRSLGRWYHGGEVDSFLEELIVAVDGIEREKVEARQETQALHRQLDVLKQENDHLWQELNALREAPAPTPGPEESCRRVCGELERERDSLIRDIKALRRFRETFRDSVKQDALSLSEQVRKLNSDKLL